MLKNVYAILLLLIVFGSCAPKESNDPEKLLCRKWTNENESKTDFNSITLSKDGSLVFVDHYEDTLHGTWTYNQESRQLHFQWKREQEVVTEIDSLIVQSDTSGSELVLFNSNYEFARIKSGTIDEYELNEYFTVDSLSSSLLLMHSETEGYTFTYQEKEIVSSFSFISFTRGLIGLAFLVLIGYLFSRNRKAIDWNLIGIGLALQIVFAIGVLKVPFIASVFEGISGFFIQVISFTQEGTNFLFSSFGTGKIESPLLNFIVMVLPTVIFFSALTSLLFYWGILQKVVYGLAWVMKKTMRLSGAESLAAAGNIFLGQTEAPLLIKPYLGKMTRSEMMCLMSGGMATIAGGVLAAYVGFLGGDDPVEQLYFAKHLLAASVMSAPAAIVAAKLLVPETETFNPEMRIPKERIGTNALEAIANGTTDGVKLAANVAAMLLVFIALIAMGNWILSDFVGEITGLNEWISKNTHYHELSLQFIVGYSFAPIAAILGVPTQDIVLIGQLMGEKTILNEFYAYTTLGKMKESGVFSDPKSVIMATYILCGFSNFASIGIQIGGIGTLAPDRKATLSQLGFLALVGGSMACLFTAVIVGMLI